MADKRTYELDQIDPDLIQNTHCLEIDILGNSEAEHVQIGTLLSGRSYLIPILNWAMSATRHHIIANVPNVPFHIDSITIVDDNGNEHIGSSIFDLKLAGEYGVETSRRPKDAPLTHYLKPATFGVRAHSEFVIGGKNLRLMHDYPTAIDTGVLRGDYPVDAIDGSVSLRAGDYDFFLSLYASYTQSTLPRIGWIVYDPTETYFPAGTYIKSVDFRVVQATVAAVITLSNAIKLTTGNRSLTFYSENRPYKDSMKYGLECNSSNLINTEGAGNYINETGHLVNFSSASGTRGYVKITIPFAE